MVEQRSPKPRAEGSIPSAPAKSRAPKLCSAFLFYFLSKPRHAERVVGCGSPFSRVCGLFCFLSYSVRLLLCRFFSYFHLISGRFCGRNCGGFSTKKGSPKLSNFLCVNIRLTHFFKFLEKYHL